MNYVVGAPGTDLQGWRWAHGRASRREYCLWLAAILAWSAILSLEGGGLVRIVLGFAAILQILRRLHDLGKSAQWLLVILFGQIAAAAIPSTGAEGIVAVLLAVVLGLAPFVLLALWPGQREANRYGPPRPGWRFAARPG